MDLREMFESNAEEFLNFESVQNKRHLRRDIHGMLLLAEIIPAGKNIIDAAEHDRVFFSVDVEELEKVITPQQVIELIRCGITMDPDTEGLYMWV